MIVHSTKYGIIILSPTLGNPDKPDCNLAYNNKHTFMQSNQREIGNPKSSKSFKLLARGAKRRGFGGYRIPIPNLAVWRKSQKARKRSSMMTPTTISSSMPSKGRATRGGRTNLKWRRKRLRAPTTGDPTVKGVLM